MLDIKLAIFDLDGTLIDAYRAITESCNYTLRRLGLPRSSDAEIIRAVGWGDKAFIAAFFPQGLAGKAIEIYRSHHKQSLRRYSKLKPYAKTLLRLIKRKGIKLAVASNRPTEFSLILLRHFRIERYFDYVLCADKLRYPKPHPAILNRVTKNTKVGKKYALYVGDMALDAQAGLRAGVKTIVVLGGSGNRRDIEKERPYKIVKGLREVGGCVVNGESSR